MTIDEVIEALNSLREIVGGDVPVFCGGEDYPSEVGYVTLEGERRPYYTNPPYVTIKNKG
jgi:hypothetical protein